MVREIKNLIGNHTTISISLMLSLIPIVFTCGIYYNKLINVETDTHDLKNATLVLTKLVSTHELRLDNLEKIVKKD